MARDKFSSKEEAETAIELAIGRLFRMGARPTEPEDAGTYWDCRTVVFDAVEYLYLNEPTNKSYQDLYFNHIFK